MHATRMWILENPIVAFVLAAVLIMAIALGLASVVPDQMHSLIDGTLGGLVASLGSYALVQFFILKRETFGLQRWLRFQNGNVWIIPTYMSHSSAYPYMDYFVAPPFDAQAAAYMAQLLRLARVHYPERKIVGSHRLRDDILADNLVILCLPHRNQYARLYLGLINDIYIKHVPVRDAIIKANVDSFLQDVDCTREYFALKAPSRASCEWQMRNYGEPEGREWYQSTINRNPGRNVHTPGEVLFDFATIVKCPNPFNRAASIVLVCGIHGIGTLGGALYLYEHAVELYSHYPDEAQCHFLQVRYDVKPGGDNYVDAEILDVQRKYYLPLQEGVR